MCVLWNTGLSHSDQQTKVSKMLANLSTDDERHQVVYKRQRIFWIVFLLAFLIYMPIGLPLVCWDHLTMEDCLNLELGDAYCAEKALSTNTTLTVLWKYEECFTINQLRSISITVIMFSLIGYVTTFSLRFRSTSKTDAA